MGIISEFLTTSRDLVAWAAKLQQREKEQLIAIVGGLATELQRGIALMIVFLDGLALTPDEAIPASLRTGGSRVINGFREFEICAGLYSLRSRFGSLLDPATAAVEITRIDAISTLIDQLAGGERMVLDDFREILEDFETFAGRFETALAQPDPSPAIAAERQQLTERVKAIRLNLRETERRITDTTRAIIDAIG